MRSQGSAPELERRRELAVARVKAGYSQQEVAAFLGVHRSTVSRWVCAARDGGTKALKAKPTPGRPRKLTARQEKTVLGWVAKLPTHFGFATDLWTSRRVATLIEQRLGVRFNSNYLVEWLRAREHTRRSLLSRPGSATRPPSCAGGTRTGRACKKSPGTKGSPCPD